MKHRLQGDKKTLASDGRMPGLTSEQPRRNPRLQGGVLCVISPPQGTRQWWSGFYGMGTSSVVPVFVLFHIAVPVFF